MAVLNGKYLEGRLKIHALWFDPAGGLDGRIAALVEHKGNVFYADVTCGLKFACGRRDSLRKGWQFSEETAEAIRRKMRAEMNKTKDMDEYRDLEKCLKDDFLVTDMFRLAGRKKPVVAYLIWDKPHHCHWHANIGMTHLDLYPKKKNVPQAVEQKARELNALWPEDWLKVKTVKVVDTKSVQEASVQL